MLVDELQFFAKAGDGGDGVVRWLRLKYRPNSGPAGGDGGKGGDVYVRGVRDVSLLGKYTGKKEFTAKKGDDGGARSKAGRGSEDCYIDVPIGSVITNIDTGHAYAIDAEGQTERILKGGQGGLGNQNFKSSINRSPQESTKGKPGEQGHFTVELKLSADVGLIGLPNAGKSTLLNVLTNAKSAIGAYPFTTIEPHLGDFYGYVLADIPGLIEGAAAGKGLGHKFLKHIQKTKMLLHLVSLESTDPVGDYRAVRAELVAFDQALADKKEWIVLTKADLVTPETALQVQKSIDTNNNRVFILTQNSPENIKILQEALSRELQN